MDEPETKIWAHLILNIQDQDPIRVPLSSNHFTIGRSQNCDHCIADKIVSAQHCRIIRHAEDGQVYLEDTSTNGMLINRTLRTTKGKQFLLNDEDEIFLVYRKTLQGKRDSISFRLELIQIHNPEKGELDQTLVEDNDESTQEYYSTTVDENEQVKKRKWDEETEGSPSNEAKKFHTVETETTGISKPDGNEITVKDISETTKPAQDVNENKLELEPLTSSDKKEDKSKEADNEECEDEMMATLICSICHDILHDCISLQPCMHTFCSACFSQWMVKSSRCPTCRKVAKRISKNHIVNNLVDAFLKVNPEKRRSPEDIDEMNSRNKITTDTVINPRLDEECYSEDSDEDNSSSGENSLNSLRIIGSMPLLGWQTGAAFGCPIKIPTMTCRQCPVSNTNKPTTLCGASPTSTEAVDTTALTSTDVSPGTSSDTNQNFRMALGNVRVPLPTAPIFVCPPHANHMMCMCCHERFPNRPADQSQQSNIPPVKCSMCNMFYCHMYWGCTRNSSCYGCLNKLKDMNFGTKCENVLILGNMQESTIFKKYLQQNNLTWKSVLDNGLDKMAKGECSSPVVAAHNITNDSIVCYTCGLKIFKELAYQYRELVPRDQLPAEATTRPDCYWGKNCRTQYNKPNHAIHFNHVCNQTRF